MFGSVFFYGFAVCVIRVSSGKKSFLQLHPHSSQTRNVVLGPNGNRTARHLWQIGQYLRS